MTEKFEALHVPSVVAGDDVDTYNSPELLYSTAGFTQKGVTLAGGQGVLELGTILTRNAGDHKYYKAGAQDVPAGFLRRGVDLGDRGAADQLGNLVIQGIVKYDLVKHANGGDAGLVAAHVATMNGFIDIARNTVRI